MKRKRNAVCSSPRKKQKSETSSLKVQSSLSVYHSTLSLYYQNVCPLGKVLRDWLPSTSRTRRRRLDRFDVEFAQHASFLKNTLVGYCDRPSTEVQAARRNELIAFTQTQRVTHGDSHEQRICDIGEILDFVIWNLFQKCKSSVKPPSHLLCHGYQKYSSLRENDEHMQALQLPGIVRRAGNTNAETFRRSPWTDIANLLGRDAEVIMLHLLLDCGIFEKLDSGKHNFYQVSGESISQMKLLAVTESVKLSPAERSQPIKTQARPGSIAFVRNRILYARPSLNGQGNVQLGLKHIHILNRCKGFEDPKQDTRILQYIFPRQCGLHNVFTSKTNPAETAQPFKDYTMREQEIASLDQQNVNKVPRRLRGSIVLVHKIRKNHAWCSYTQLLRHYCPIQSSQVPPITESCADESISSIQSGGFITQFRRQTTDSIKKTPSEPVSTTSFIPYATPESQVVAFCQAVVLRLLPQNTFGDGEDGKQNWRQILRSIDHFIKMRRFETVTLHEVCQSISIRCIDWLRPPTIKQQDNLSTSDKAKRVDILQELVYYIFDSVLIPLIRTNFYVTETGVHRNRLYYFRHDVWKRMADPSLAVMKLNMFEPLQPRQLRHSFASNSLGCSQMRLLPKEHGTRPIMNLRRKAMKVVNGKPVLSKGTNAQLAPIFSVLNSERQRQPEALASAMFSVGEIHNKLKDFRDSQDLCSATFYFVKVDIRSCFDTIPQKELLHFIDTFLLHEQYQIATHVEMKPISTTSFQKSTRVIPKYTMRAVPKDEDALFSSTIAAQLASNKRRHIFVGTNQERSMKLGQVRKMLADHLQHNIVRVGRRHFRQVEGIPQGSVLSSLLCNLFYSDFERQQLGFLDSQTSLLLRLIDDFLLITTNESQARQFVQAMSDGNTKHGISVNTEKSLVNFEVSIRGHKIPRLHGAGACDFPYCGMLIDTRTLSLRKDRQPRDLYVANGLSVTYSGRVGAVLQSKVISSLKRQLHKMLLDGSMNTRERVLNSIFECFVETAMKMHQYLKSLPKRKHPTTVCMANLCSQLIETGIKMAHRSGVRGTVSLTKSQMSWLAAAALSKVLSRKHCGYSSLLCWLRQVEGRARKSMNMTTWELKRMTEEGIQPFAAHMY